LLAGHRYNPMVRTLPEIHGRHVSRNGPKTAHSCRSRIRWLKSG
jgi:hypothetical protein